MSKIDIENTQLRLFVGPPLDDGTELRFIPGINHIDPEAWTRTKSVGSVPSWLKLGFLKELGGTPENVEVPEGLTVEEALAEISGMSAQEVVATIEAMGIDHKNIVEAIAEHDNREAVVTAAKLKLDTFKA